MDTFKQISGRIAPMLEPNIDTDVIMPKQFLKGIDRQGLDKGVFFDRRFMAGGQPNPDFILEHAGLAERDIPAGWPQFWLWIES